MKFLGLEISRAGATEAGQVRVEPPVMAAAVEAGVSAAACGGALLEEHFATC